MASRHSRWAAFVVLAGLLSALVNSAHAHESRPLFIEIEERDGLAYSVGWRVPGSVPAFNQPAVDLGSDCLSASAARAEPSPGGPVWRRDFHCSRELSGSTISVIYPRSNPSVSTLLRISWISGEVRTLRAGPGTEAIEIPTAESTAGVAREYFALGVGHILTGYDHLLFVLCLLFIAATARRVVIAVTGFTVAHSLTLALAALGWVQVPVPPVEAAIALSIVFLATEIVRGRQDSLTYRYPIAVSGSFGLLHGFGFASVLQEIGLPQTELPAALLFFNLGVEAGQLAFIGAVAAVFLTVRALYRGGDLMVTPGVTRAAAYVIGTLASYWMISRVAGF